MVIIKSIEQVFLEFQNRDIILVGAGKAAEEIISNYNWNIRLAVDNNPQKVGTHLSMTQKSIDVLSWEALHDDCNRTCVLLITPAYVEALIDQIASDSQLQDRDVYVYQYMRALQWDIDRIRVSKKFFSITKGDLPKIPKVIHYFWFSDDPYPEKVQKCIDSWKKYCPGYELRKWSLENYKTENVFCNEALQSRNWAFASDYGRCDVLKKYGGIYLDTDVELIKPLDDLLYDEGFFVFESSDGVDPGSGMASICGHSILEEICNQYEGIHFLNEDGTFNKVNIIDQYTSVLVKHGLVSDGSYQKIDGIVVYPPLVMSPYSYNTGLTCLIDKTYGIHHWVSAWISDEWRHELDMKRKYISEKIKTVDDLFA